MPLSLVDSASHPDFAAASLRSTPPARTMGRISIEAFSPTHATIGGREILTFGGCGYLGLSHHPRVRAALIESLDTLGLSTSASRETTGNTLTHEALELDLASFLNTESAILTPEGYTANLALAQALAWRYRVAIVDERSHRSVGHAVAAAGLDVHTFEHLSAGQAASLAARHADRGVVIYTDGVFAADGSVAPADKLYAALPERNSLLIIDDCHGFCVLGDNGRGTASQFGIAGPRLCITTTLAKGLGCYGGAIAGPGDLIRDIQTHAGVYRGTTPVPPPIAASARAALAVVAQDGSLVQSLRSNIAHMRSILSAAGLRFPEPAVPIFTFMLDSTERMEAIHHALFERGILAPLIEYPGGPASRYFRLSITAAHTAEHIDRLGRELAALIRMAA
ncbi:MAG: pyridoxal phosphate-dependent aminotransferase family protein [Phycisphaerales bacterium]|nr:pyridoxal phosphate-dependent aminotransferase family protein [Phycisphaerales bacterium]